MPYRDELEALRAREAQLSQELAETRRLRVAAERRVLPVLEELRVASPCPAKWDDMIGDDRVRFCGACAKNVYDLSAMTRAEAEAFVAAQADRTAGSVCVTMRRRADGKVLTTDCPVGVRRRRFGLGVIAFASAAAAAAICVHVHDSAPIFKSLDRSVHAPKTVDDREETVPLAPLEANDGPRAGSGITGLLAPSSSKPRSTRLTGCLCQPGDPLCSCL
jgi:hypothetical protein